MLTRRRECAVENPGTAASLDCLGRPKLLPSRTDAKGQNFTYQYDTYNRLASLTWANAPGGAQVLRTYMYDTNTLDSTFSGSYTAGRLVAVQNAKFTPGNGSPVSLDSAGGNVRLHAGRQRQRETFAAEREPQWEQLCLP